MRVVKKNHNMAARTYTPDDPSVSVVFSTMSTKERVRRAHYRRVVTSLAGLSNLPRLTAEMKKDIKMGRPVINQY